MSGIVDAEALLVAWLKANLTSALPAANISTELPAGFSKKKYLRLFRVGGADVANGWVDRPVIQVETYGGTKEEAHVLTSKFLEALPNIPAATHPRGVVTDARRIAGPRFSTEPDTDSPRYITDVILITHPKPS